MVVSNWRTGDRLRLREPSDRFLRVYLVPQDRRGGDTRCYAHLRVERGRGCRKSGHRARSLRRRDGKSEETARYLGKETGPALSKSHSVTAHGEQGGRSNQPRLAPLPSTNVTKAARSCHHMGPPVTSYRGVQQPCSNPSKPPEHLSNAPTQEFSCFAAILQTPERFSKVSRRLCTAEVRGSNPLGSTLKICRFAGNTGLPPLEWPL